MIVEELTPEFLANLAGMSKLISYLSSTGTENFGNDVLPKSITSLDTFWDLHIKLEQQEVIDADKYPAKLEGSNI